MFRSKELSERLIKDVAKRIGKAPTDSLTEKALEAMRGISKSSFTLWIVQEFNPPILEKFDGKTNLITHLL